MPTLIAVFRLETMLPSRLVKGFTMYEDRWLCATVTDLQTKKVLMTAEPVVRLM